MHNRRLYAWIFIGLGILGIIATNFLAHGAWMIMCLWSVVLVLAVAYLLAPFLLPPLGMKGRKDKCSKN